MRKKKKKNKLDLKQIKFKSMEWIHLAQDGELSKHGINPCIV
jgi:hypothetical protein